MPQLELWQVFVSLGVPGLALGVFYMLFRTFRWDFPKVPQKWVAPIVILFMLLTAAVVLYALTLWAPGQNQSSDNTQDKVNRGTPSPTPDVAFTKSVVVIYQKGETLATSGIAKFGLSEENYDDVGFNVARFQKGVLISIRANGIHVPSVAFRAFSFDRKMWLPAESAISQIRGDGRIVLVESSAVSPEQSLEFFWLVASTSPVFR